MESLEGLAHRLEIVKENSITMESGPGRFRPTANRVKLPAHRTGLPGYESNAIYCAP